MGLPVLGFLQGPALNIHRNGSQRSDCIPTKAGFVYSGSGGRGSSEGETGHLCRPDWSQAARASLTLQQRSPPGETPGLGLHPRFAVVIYFWYVSLPSPSGKARKPKEEQQDILLWPRASAGEPLQRSTVPTPQGALRTSGFLSHSLRGLRGPNSE